MALGTIVSIEALIKKMQYNIRSHNIGNNSLHSNYILILIRLCIVYPATYNLIFHNKHWKPYNRHLYKALAYILIEFRVFVT